MDHLKLKEMDFTKVNKHTNVTPVTNLFKTKIGRKGKAKNYGMNMFGKTKH